MADDSEKKDCPIYVRLRSSDRTALVVLATMRGVSQSQAVRDAITEAAARELDGTKDQVR